MILKKFKDQNQRPFFISLSTHSLNPKPIPTSNLLIYMYMSNCDFKVCFGKLVVGFTLLLNLDIERLIFEPINALHMSNACKKRLAPIKKNQNNSLKLVFLKKNRLQNISILCDNVVKWTYARQKNFTWHVHTFH